MSCAMRRPRQDCPPGAYEIPLLLQDRDLEIAADTGQPTGRFSYQDLTTNNTFKHDYFLANGTITPFKKVDRAKYRLRILNGAKSPHLSTGVSRGHRFTFHQRAWTVIGVDGGLLRRRCQIQRLASPRERRRWLC